jgi:hypothetical protein
MYQKLNNFYIEIAETDDKKYPCTSLAVTDNFQNYNGEVPYVERELYTSPRRLRRHTPMHTPMHTPLPMRTPLLSHTPSHTPLPSYVQEGNSFSCFTESENLLPVLDPEFNLREICKQSALLEDHLSHDQKRCKDCCIKHFITLEALCEEAITLDKDENMKDKIKNLPSYIREVQKKWYEDPKGNAHECAQMLRKLRKEFMQSTFDVIFKKSCSSGVCSL